MQEIGHLRGTEVHLRWSWQHILRLQKQGRFPRSRNLGNLQAARGSRRLIDALPYANSTLLSEE